jgi:hypothetical protein
VQSIKDDAYIASGSHEGGNGATDLYDTDGHFLIMGLITGTVCYNTTQVTNGLITAVGRNTLTVTGVTWDTDDEYEVYATATKDSVLGIIGIDKRFGRKAYEKDLDGDGLFPADRDLDENWHGVARPFGPGQPKRG